MPKKRKPTATPKQLHSQKPKKQQKQQQGTKRTTRVGLGLSTEVSKLSTKGHKPKSQRQPQQPVAQPVQHSTSAPTPVKQRPTTKVKQGASEIVAQWAVEWERVGQADVIDKYLEQFGHDTQKLEEAIKSGQVERATSRLTDMQTGEVMSNVISNINTDENFYSTFIIESWRRQLDTYASGEAYTMLKNWLDDMIAQNGKDNVAEMLQRGASEGHLLTWETVYKVGEAERYISAMLDYLPDQSELYKEEIQDKFEYYKAMTDYMEQEENWEEPV